MIIKNQKAMLYFALSFIVLYGSGFVGAKLGFPYAKPLVFLVIRFAVSSLILLILALSFKSKWPNTLMQTIHISVAGLFLVCMFSIGTWISMDLGVPPATSALIIALQPLIVSIGVAFFFKQKLKFISWVGLLIGLIGVIMVVIEQAKFNHSYAIGILMSFIGLFGLAAGSLYQKRFCKNLDIFTTGVIQSAVAGLTCLLLYYFSGEPFIVLWTGKFIFALFWMCIIVSLGAISCLYILILNGESSKVASLFYLVPIVTALISFIIFGTRLDLMQIFGMLIAIFGVGVVNIIKK